MQNRQLEINKLEQSRSSFSSTVHNSHRLSLAEQEQLLSHERDKHEKLIGQLKAAEARSRTRLLRKRYVNLKEDETDHLVDSQPTALRAARLEAFLPNFKAARTMRNELAEATSRISQIERRRLDAIVDGALIERKLN